MPSSSTRRTPAIGNESAKDIIQALSSDEDLKEATDFNREDYDSDMDAIMAYMQSSRQKMHHLSLLRFHGNAKRQDLCHLRT
jgi:type I restriction enzyme R subunit